MFVFHDAAGIECDEQVRGIRAMIDAGFSVSKEPFLHGLLSAVRLHLLKVTPPPPLHLMPEEGLYYR